MAGEWIPMRLDLADDPAVIGIAEAVGIAPDAVVGKLHRLWSWANRHLEKGEAGLKPGWCDNYVSCDGFAAAMVSFGWLKLDAKGSVIFPMFERWNSEGAKNRLRKNRIQAERRSRSEAGLKPKRGVISDSKGTTREEKRREEKREEKIHSADAVAKVEKPRDELFDAIAELSGLDPKTGKNGSHIGSATASLRKASPPYTAADVQDFGRRFHELCPYAARNGSKRPTVGEIEKNIGLLRAAPAPPQRSPAAAQRLFPSKAERSDAEFQEIVRDAFPEIQ